MVEREGVIRFNLEFTESACIEPHRIVELDGWRSILHRLQLIGMQPDRYHGLGFGNVSLREREGSDGFIITGTQTGAPEQLDPADYALVSECDPFTNTIRASGQTRPSSEALTHGQIYQLEPSVNCVVHAHSPDIWNAAHSLKLPMTATDVQYGTPEMALAVKQLFSSSAGVADKIFVMAGHEDGIVSFGQTVREACEVMISALVSAFVALRSS